MLSGEMTWLGITVYRATLYAPQGLFNTDQPYALRIDYQLNFSRNELALSSVREIKRIFGDEPDANVMRATFESVLRDVSDGDHIIGVHRPGEGAQFYSDGQLLGRIDDLDLANAFFAIWLSPDTREPGLRAQLTGSVK